MLSINLTSLSGVATATAAISKNDDRDIASSEGDDGRPSSRWCRTRLLLLSDFHHFHLLLTAISVGLGLNDHLNVIGRVFNGTIDEAVVVVVEQWMDELNLIIRILSWKEAKKYFLYLWYLKKKILALCNHYSKVITSLLRTCIFKLGREQKKSKRKTSCPAGILWYCKKCSPTHAWRD